MTSIATGICILFAAISHTIKGNKFNKLTEEKRKETLNRHWEFRDHITYTVILCAIVTRFTYRLSSEFPYIVGIAIFIAGIAFASYKHLGIREQFTTDELPHDFSKTVIRCHLLVTIGIIVLTTCTSIEICMDT